MEANLRESFRVLAKGRFRADIADFEGVSVASLGAAFQMFNAAFLSSRVTAREDLERRLGCAHDLFSLRKLPWSFWICEDWLSRSVRRALPDACEAFGLRAVAEMPALVADAIRAPGRFLLRDRVPPILEIRPATDARIMADFRAIGSVCFHVPPAWFAEVFDDSVPSREFRCWVGYRGGNPVATAATVVTEGAIGLYNVATVPGEQGKGYGEAITRYAVAAAVRESGPRRVILQSTAQGERLYRRLGFREISRVVVFNSVTRF